MAAFLPSIGPAERSVEIIYGESYASGYRIGGPLVITSAHTFSSKKEPDDKMEYKNNCLIDSKCQIKHRYSNSPSWTSDANIIWTSGKIDIALLEIRNNDVDHIEPAKVGKINIFNTEDRSPLKVEIIGWPLWGRTNDQCERREIPCEIYPIDSSSDNFFALEAKRKPDNNNSDPSESPWAGASGGAVLYKDFIVGVYCRHQNISRTASLEAEHLYKAFDDNMWCALLKEHEISIDIEQITQCKNNQYTSISNNPKKQDIHLEPTAGFPGYSDPEYVVNCSSIGDSFDNFKMTLECQLKLHLLTNLHILIPGGYFFDNPGLWYLLHSSESFRELLLSHPDKTSSNTTLVISKHQETYSNHDKTRLDAIFRTWFVGNDGKRLNNPSSLRTNWINHINKENSESVLTSLRRRWESLTIDEYSNLLSLDLLKASLNSIEYIFDNSSSIATPTNRHIIFFRGVKSILDRDTDFIGKEELLQLIHQTENSKNDKISRSEIQKYAPTAWESIKNELISLRQYCYFKNYKGTGNISALPNSGVTVSRKTMSNLLKEVEELLNARSYLVAIDELTFEEVLEMRKHPGLMQSIKELYLTNTLTEPERTNRFVDILKYEWSENLLDAASQVEKSKKEGRLVIHKKSQKYPILQILSTAATILPTEIEIPSFTLKNKTLLNTISRCAPLVSGFLPKTLNYPQN